jgi:hypothetical protein
MMQEEKEPFRMRDHEPEARLARLSPGQAEALEQALSRLSESVLIKRRSESDQNLLPFFMLPFAEFGMTRDQMIRLGGQIPADYTLEHRAIYFDFRLERWMRHIEPPTVSECLEDYFENSESPEQALAYLDGQWQTFLRRHRPA